MKTIITVLAIAALAVASVPLFHAAEYAWGGFSSSYTYARSTGDWSVFRGKMIVGLSLIAASILGVLALSAVLVRRARRANRAGFNLESTHHA
jgi:hypothetical protein